MSRIYLHLRASLIHIYNLVYILDIKLRIYALREHIICKRQHVHVSCPLTVAEKSPLYTLRSRKHG